MDHTGIHCQPLAGKDLPLLRELLMIYQQVFETDQFRLSDDKFLQDLLSNQQILFIVAVENAEVLGGLTAYLLPSVYENNTQVYIYDLGVKESRQRQGIGKKLMSCLKNHCAALGYREIYVQAHAEDKEAISFYQSLGGSADEVFHFSFRTQ